MRPPPKSSSIGPVDKRAGLKPAPTDEHRLDVGAGFKPARTDEHRLDVGAGFKPARTVHHWFKDGIRFACKGCGECCRTHSDYEYVFVVAADIRAISAHLEMDESDFLEQYCVLVDGYYSLIYDAVDCPFLVDGKCRIYPVRPKQCQTWPFWTENLDRARWEGPVAKCCPGIGEGRLYSCEEILSIAAERDRWYLG